MEKAKLYTLRVHKMSNVVTCDIEGEDLQYADMSPSHHGVQCNHIGGTMEFDLILEKCKQISTLMKEVMFLNNSIK